MLQYVFKEYLYLSYFDFKLTNKPIPTNIVEGTTLIICIIFTPIVVFNWYMKRDCHNVLPERK